MICLGKRGLKKKKKEKRKKKGSLELVMNSAHWGSKTGSGLGSRYTRKKMR